MLPEEIEQIFEIYSEDDCSYSIKKVSIPALQDVEMEFDLSIPTNNEIQSWRVFAKGQLKNNIVFDDSADFLRVFEEHPLLWEFTDIQGDLYFSGKIRDYNRLMHELFLAHYEVLGKYLPFELAQNFNSPNGAFQFSNGLLAKGPRKLLKRYSEVLSYNSVKFSIIDGWKPKTENLKILFIGSSYIVARDFVFEKLQSQINGKII